MEFKDSLHFKNYVRKIAESCGFEKEEFEKTKIPIILISVFDFQREYEKEIFEIGAPNIIENFIKELKKLYYCAEILKKNIFFDTFFELDRIHEQLKIICLNLKNEKLKDGFNLFNYFNEDFLKPHKELKILVRDNNKFNYLNETDFIPSSEFKELVESHIGKFGLYFLYDENKALMYIGKSTSLGDRILSSIFQRKINGFIKIALTERIADIHVYEPYYVIRENPFLNVDFKAYDELSIELKPLKKSKLIKILTKEN